MSYTIRHDPALNIIRIKVKSSMTAPLARTICLEATDLASKHGSKGLLFDFGATGVAEETMGIYGVATSLSDLGVDPDVKLAGVVTEEDPNHRFFETVAKNRGYDVRYFKDTAEAERWLTRGRSSPAGGRGGATS